MALNISNRIKTAGTAHFHTYAFRNTLENHLELIKNSPSVTTITINEQDRIRFHFDFYGLLRKYNVDPQFWWITMRCNGFHAPHDYGGMFDEIIIPDQKELNLLLGRTLNKEKPA